jgi:large exoprotein involved in heme utilization and adhesion
MKFTSYILVLSFFSNIHAESLFQVFQNSGPANGYDVYIELNSENIYTGGLGIYEGSVYIEGNGAVINLQDGGGIWAYADDQSPASLEINRCTIINGAYYGINFAGTATGSVTNCNIINSGMGFQALDFSVVELKNCNIMANEIYGVAIFSENPDVSISFCNAWNNGEDYMENCPG